MFCGAGAGRSGRGSARAQGRRISLILEWGNLGEGRGGEEKGPTRRI